jgi:hypothetical protein
MEAGTPCDTQTAPLRPGRWAVGWGCAAGLVGMARSGTVIVGLSRDSRWGFSVCAREGSGSDVIGFQARQDSLGTVALR